MLRTHFWPLCLTKAFNNGIIDISSRQTGICVSIDYQTDPGLPEQNVRPGRTFQSWCFSLYSPGLTPVYLRKTRLKWLCEEKPR